MSSPAQHPPSAAVHILAVSDVTACSAYLVDTFNAADSSSVPSSGISSSSNLSQSTDTCNPHEAEHTRSLLIGLMHIIVVSESKCPPILKCNPRLILVVDKIEDVIKNAVAGGGKVLEQGVYGGKELCVLEGPLFCGKCTFVVTESDIIAGSSTSVKTIKSWCAGSTDNGGAENILKSSHTHTAATQKEAWNPPKGPTIPTIFPSVMHDGEFRPIHPNSSTPIPFKTEYFEGEMLLLVRTTPLEPRYKHVFQKVSELTNKAGTMTFEVQCQGKFTKTPNGRLYIGAEITKKMNLGLFTRGVCYTVLQFVNSINPFIHSSFGDKENAELPHITGPLWCLADKVVISPPGSNPPKLGQILPENKEARAFRRSQLLHEEKIDLNSTYSFSVNTDNIELCDWNMVNVPLTNSMDLHTFWDDADIRLCCYCVPSDDGLSPDDTKTIDAKSAKALAKKLPKYHYQATNQYLLCVQLEHLSNHPGRSPNSDSIEDTDGSTMLLASSTDEPYFNLNDDGSSDNEIDDDGSVDSDDDTFYDAMDGNEDSYYTVEKNISRPSSRVIRKSESTEKLSEGANNFVPAVVLVSDVVRHRSLLGVGSSQRELYIFRVPKSVLHPNSSSSSKSAECVVTIQSYREYAKVFGVEGCFKTQSYSRMSRTEQRRNDLCHSMSRVIELSSEDEKLQKQIVDFFAVSTHMEYFLLAEKINNKNGKRNGVGNPRLRSDLGSSFLMEGFVCTRQGQSHWSEEYLCVTTDELIFIQHSTRLAEKRRRRIPLEYVLSFKFIDATEASFPLEECYCIVFSTFPREFSVLVRGRTEIGRWMAVLPELFEGTGRRAMDSDLPLTNSFKQLELFSHPKDWKLGGRVLLNCRRYCGRGRFEIAVNESQFVDTLPRCDGMSEKISTMNAEAKVFNDRSLSSDATYAPASSHLSRTFPVVLAEKALKLISDISVFSNSMENILSWDNFLETHWMEFLDIVSLLPCIDLEHFSLSTEERICIFLNLYHTMLLHAVLVAGVPSTLMKWPNFFNSFSYEAFGDVFSLSELEHSIIKGAFKTNGLVPQIVIRQSKYDFALPTKDIRLLFAMNCGSLSMPSTVPIFRPIDLEDQLDTCVRNCLKKQLHITRGSGKLFIVKLPLLCQWYEDDVLELCNDMEFSSEYKKATKLLRLFINYCGKEQKDILLELITNEKSSYSFKYSKFDFRCRILKVTD